MERVLCLAIVAALSVAIGPVAAQEIGQPGHGLAVAQNLCAECHGVQKGQASPNASAPTFATIANVPGMTATALSAALQTSHRTMPNIVLAPDEMRDVIVYIQSLKGG